MSGRDFDLICLGSGPAGQRAAVQAAKLGKRAVVVERRPVLGGVALETGTIPSKTLREAVLALSQDPLGRRGRVPRAQPSAEQLGARIHQVVSREGAVIEHQLLRNGVEVIRGEGAFRDPNTVAVRTDGGWRTITAGHVLIAVGTRPALAPAGATGLVITSDGILPLERLPRTMAVVGAGVIGIEYASIFAALGVEVTVVDRRERVLEFLDREIVDELVHQMRSRDVIFRLGEAVERLDATAGPPRRAVLVLESGKRIVSERVLFCVGRQGATDALNLEAAGLAADARGRLRVDERFRTAVPHILAAGDVIGFPSLAATSSQQGRLAACYAFGAPAGAMAADFPVGIYAIPEISMVGRTEEELTRDRVPYEVGLARYREIARGQILGDDTGLFKMLFHRESRRLLGAHAIGTHATELIHVAHAVLAHGGGLDYFLDAVFNYPTLAECYKVAALDAANRLAL
ncbi:MAG: Si-specific NAD(P)(+) transhydrogenase [Candidatus Rokuibacteriota bacterium]